MRSTRDKLLGLVFILALLTVTLPASGPVMAANKPTIAVFHASCYSFSVDVTLTGVTNDSAGFDRFRYLVTDGAGKILYMEDSARQVRVSDQARVVNVGYNMARPSANPIRFSVIDLDTIGRQGEILQQAEFQSACFAPGAEKLSLADLLPQGVRGTMRAATPLYTAPDGDKIDLSVEAGREFTAIYRTANEAWVGLYVGGESLVWVPGPTIDLPLNKVAVVPTRIDQSQQVTGAVLPSLPSGTVRLRYTLRFRSTPAILSNNIIGRIPFNSVVAVWGRTADNAWILVSYQGIGGFVASRYVTFLDTPLRLLPIIR